jgi:glycosyltransferase involved in cell wall biosynthesis
MNIISLGIYSKSPEYPRYNNLLQGLRDADVRIIECNHEMAGGSEDRLRSVKNPINAFLFGLRLLSSYLIITIKYLKSPSADAILVGYPGYFHVHFARFLKLIKNRDAILIFDIFFSLYDTLVNDRKLIGDASFISKAVHRLEKSSLQASDIVLVDTITHGNTIAEEYGIGKNKLKRIFVGSSFGPPHSPIEIDTQPVDFKVLFIGTYIPLHGIDVILKAAGKLGPDKDIRFVLVGKGQLRNEMEMLARNLELKNVDFEDWVPTSQLAEKIRSFDLSLGIFGTTKKARSVIPIKVFDICAAGMPVVSADTPAMREAFVHRESAFMVPPGDHNKLAEAILELKTDHKLRERLAKGANDLARSVFSTQKTGAELIEAVDQHINNSVLD